MAELLTQIERDYMENQNRILNKQLEISSHQTHFNLLLAIATTFLVLIYALERSSSFSRYYGAGSDVIIVVMVFVLMVLWAFLIKQGYISKLFRLFN